MTRQTKTELSAATVLQHWVPFPSVSLPQGPPMGHHILAFEKKTKKPPKKSAFENQDISFFFFLMIC